MANPDESEPVIVSSNRYNDIAPYTKKLFAENPKVWMQVLPWEFPQQKNQSPEQMKLEEETFLREFFSEREIRMQGGADGPGNGFRFLKQVWYYAAIWNVNGRLPAVVNWWFDNNQTLLNDENMKDYLFKPDVKPSTFFQAAELEMYGEKFLGWAVKQIQLRLRPELIEPSQATAAAAPAATTQAQTAPVEPTPVAPQRTTSSNIDKPASSTSASSVGGKLAPTAQPYQAQNPQAPLATAPIQQTRSVSGDTNPFSERHELPVRKQRGSFNGKRNSFNSNRPNFRQSQPSGEMRYAPGQLPRFDDTGNSRFNAPPGLNKARLPSGGPPVFSPRNVMPPLPQGQAIPSPAMVSPLPFAATMHQSYEPSSAQLPPPSGRSVSGFMPGAYQPGSMQTTNYDQRGPGSVADGNMMHEQPFGDRSNFQPDRAFNNKQGLYSNGPKMDFRPKQRRESVTSRSGGKNRGYGSLRGRGSRGRNSFGQSYGGIPFMDSQTFDRESWYAPNGPDDQAPARRFSHQRDIESQGPNWRAQNENSIPRTFGQDARLDSISTPRGKYVPGGFNSNSEIPAYEQQDSPMTAQPSWAMDGRKSYQTSQPLCIAGCIRSAISDTCTTATKLVVFGSEEDNVKRFLERNGVGGIIRAGRPYVPMIGTAPTYTFVEFRTVDLARQFLNLVRGGGLTWPYGRKLTAEIAKEHWDPTHFSRQTQQAPNTLPISMAPEAPDGGSRPRASMSGLHELPPKPALAVVFTHTAQEVIPKPAPGVTATNTAEEVIPKPEDQGVGQLNHEPLSEDTTPNASGPSTPRKKKKSQRKKKAQNNAQHDGTGLEGPTDMTSERKDSVSPSEDGRVKDKAGEDLVEKAAELTVQSDDNQKPADHSAPPADDNAASPVRHDVKENANAGDDIEQASPKAPANTQHEEAPHVAGAKEEVEVGSGELKKHQEEIHQPEARGSDDQIEDSFHTAGDSPKQDSETVSAASEELDVATLEHTSVKTVTEPEAAPDAIVSPPAPAGEQSDELGSNAATPKPSKKAPIPQFPKTRNVSIVLPPVDTKAAAEVGEIQGETVQSAVERIASNSTDAAASAFMTAPNTPALPEASPDQSKKAAKAKGPVQTESLSIFGKKKDKKNKKNKAGSMRVKPKSDTRVMSETDCWTASISASQEVSSQNTKDNSEAGSEHHRSRADTSTDTTESGRTASRRGTGVFGTLGSTIEGLFKRGSGHTTPAPETQGPEATNGAVEPPVESKETAKALSHIDTSTVSPAPQTEERVDSVIEEPAGSEAKVENAQSDGDDAGQDSTGLGITTESPLTKSKKNRKKKSNKKRKETVTSVADTQLDAADKRGQSPGECSASAASPGDVEKRTPSGVKLRGKKSDVSANGLPTVTFLIISHGDDEQQGTQPAQQGRVIEEIDDDDEKLSPDVMAAKERLEQLKIAEKAAKEKKAKHVDE